jgi:riboflavin synthase
MFTGIVEELGEVIRLDRLADSARLYVRGKTVTEDARHGDSIAVNGVCLTVVDVSDGAFTADVMQESLDRSDLGGLGPGDPVNLERPVPAGGRLGGHIVQGHVDGVGTILDRTPAERWEVVRIGIPERLARFLVEKGSVAVDGVSLTVVEVGAGSAESEGGGGGSAAAGPFLSVALIPTTLALTTLGRKQVGALVNIEVDVIAKHVERLLSPALPDGGEVG